MLIFNELNYTNFTNAVMASVLVKTIDGVWGFRWERLVGASRIQYIEYIVYTIYYIH